MQQPKYFQNIFSTYKNMDLNLFSVRILFYEFVTVYGNINWLTAASPAICADR